VEERLQEGELLWRREGLELAAGEVLVGEWCGVSGRLGFRRSVQQKKRLVCELRALERELRVLEERRKIVELCPDLILHH